MRRLHLVVLAGVLLLALASSSQARAGVVVKAPPAKLAPPIVCTMANRLDVFIDEDNIMWACECEALTSGFICRWQVIGGVESVSSRRYLRKHKGKPFWITFQRNGKQTHYLSTFMRMP